MLHRLVARAPWRLLVVPWLLCLAIWYVSFQPQFSFSRVPKLQLSRSQLLHVFHNFYHRHAELDAVETHSEAFDEIFSLVLLYEFLKLNSLQDRCNVYFNHLEKSNPDWTVDPNEKLEYKKEAFRKFEDYRKLVLEDYERKLKEAELADKDIPSAPLTAQIRADYDRFWELVHSGEQRMHNFLAHARVFNKCFLLQKSREYENDTLAVRTQRQFLKLRVAYQMDDLEQSSREVLRNPRRCADVEGKVFPWLTMEYPKYVRHDRKALFFPRNIHRGQGTCFLADFKQRLNGRGIVMTISDSFVEEAVRNIRVLRHFRNTYPIEIIYHSNLSPDSQRKLTQAAREKFADYPAQELWFVDITRAIEPKFILRFSGFANKISATLFNSFEEMILIDADLVLLQPPSYFFSLDKYTRLGTMFYKDRAAFQFRPKQEIRIFQKLSPSLYDSIVFNIPQLTNKTLTNEFFNGFQHYMESGLVVINRRRHFLQPLIMAMMNFYNPIVSAVYGDKELFWLAMILAGDEEYEFNDNFAAASGELTPETERHKDIKQAKTFASKEICLNHPSHIADTDNHTLVWLNSGFRFCGNTKKNMDFQAEFDRKKRFTHLKLVEEFRAFFELQMKITHSIIPPHDINRQAAKNNEHEPDAGWVMTLYCKGYCWCAYSLLGGYYTDSNGETKSNKLEGRVVEFTPAEVAHFDAVGKVWMAPIYHDAI